MVKSIVGRWVLSNKYPHNLQKKKVNQLKTKVKMIAKIIVLIYGEQMA